MENMTKEQAIKALEAGQRISHRYFEDHEWIKLINGFKYLSEDGAIHEPKVFWNTRNGKEWETDWSIFGGSVAAPKDEEESLHDQLNTEQHLVRVYKKQLECVRQQLKEREETIKELLEILPPFVLNVKSKAIIERARKLLSK